MNEIWRRVRGQGGLRPRSTSRALGELVAEQLHTGEPTVSPTEVSPREHAVGQDAANTATAVVRRTARKRACLGVILVAADRAVRKAMVDGQAALRHPAVAERRVQAEEAREILASTDRSLRQVIVPAWLATAVLVIAFLVDAGFIIGLMQDLFDLSLGDLWRTIPGITAIATGLITPLGVVLTAELGGRAWARERAAAERLRIVEPVSTKPAPWWQRWPLTLTAITVALLMGFVFFQLAHFRFLGESSRVGAAQAPVGLFSILFAAIPMMALLSSSFSRDALLSLAQTRVAAGDALEKALIGSTQTIDDAVTALRTAWLDLARLVREVVDEGNLSLATWAQLLARAASETGRMGVSVPLDRAVTAAQTMMLAEPAVEGGSCGPLPLVHQQNPLTVPVPPWVVDALAHDVHLLRTFQPMGALHQLPEVQALLEAFAPVPTPESDEPATPTPPVNGHTAGEVELRKVVVPDERGHGWMYSTS